MRITTNSLGWWFATNFIQISCSKHAITNAFKLACFPVVLRQRVFVVMSRLCGFSGPFPALCAIALTLGGTVAAAQASLVTIELQGQIAPKCGLSGMAGQLDFGPVSNFAARQERAVSFAIDCNAPFVAALTSANGEMRLREGAAGAAGFAARFPYQVLMTIPTDDGGTLRTLCDSAALGSAANVPGCQGDSGETTAMGKTAALTVSWGPIAAPLIAGHYFDDLRISVGSKD
jgi:hypothetical protein